LNNKKLKVAIIGTQGIPAQYGGFETLVEYITKYLSDRLDITVFCSKEQKKKLIKYNESNLVYLPLSANGLQGIIFDSLSIIKSYKYYDKILVLGSSNVVMSFMGKYRNKFLLNIGGIEWQRAKWGFFASLIIKYSEKISVKNTKYLIADNEGIKCYLLKKYNRESYLVEYGGDQAERINEKEKYINKYPFLKKEYLLVVARIQKDNNIEMIIKSIINIKKYKLVIVGNWEKSNYGKKIKQKYKKTENIILIDAVYNKNEMNVLRTNTRIYIHGHSAGGTNPGLVEAMYMGLPIFCFDNSFNRYTTENKAVYFDSLEKLQNLILSITDELLNEIAKYMKTIAERRYKWEIITNKYFNIITSGEENNE
jgi:glycosyltransferase involved in cell wall biosynthesis